MSDPKRYKVGDEVWIKARVEIVDALDEDSPVRVSAPDGSELVSWPAPRYIRTDADFKDPLDDAIVKAAMEWQERVTVFDRFSRRLVDVVQAKVEANKPRKTAKQILKTAYVVSQRDPEGDWRMHVDDKEVDRLFNELHDAGLLKESDDVE